MRLGKAERLGLEIARTSHTQDSIRYERLRKRTLFAG